MKTPADILEHASRAGRKAFYHLVPRYTSGSPAMVSLGEAAHVADSERAAHANCLTGVFGEELRVKAETKGLGGIAYARWEKGGKVYRLDLLTGIESIEPPRLDSWERDRVKDLRLAAEYAKRDSDFMTPAMRSEWMALEARLEVHRDTVT